MKFSRVAYTAAAATMLTLGAASSAMAGEVLADDQGSEHTARVEHAASDISFSDVFGDVTVEESHTTAMVYPNLTFYDY
ncbi:hypothetical protein [Streptomyces sp. NPDC056480]|uniref:hypothetical protein n=1 Tax=Streptomyces sp. NPDC056480 TaxID=3345833 RepID=UPI00369C6C81